jgi:hypothetical protein
MTRLTTSEVRLVEQYVGVLDYVSRCAQAVEREDWFYLYDKTAELAVRAERLAETAADLWRTIDTQRRRPPRGAIAAAVTRHGSHYRAGRLLHPAEPRERRR